MPCAGANAARIPGQGGSDSRWDLTCHFAILNWHLSFVIPNFGSIEMYFFAWLNWCWAHTVGGFRYFYNRKLDWYISFPHLCGEWGVNCKSYLVAIWWNLLTFRRKNKKVLASVATVSWRDFPRKKGLAFSLHKRNLSDDTLGFRISVAWRRTIWSLQLGDKMQLGHGQQNATDSISEMCHIFRFLSDKIWHKGLRVWLSFLD